MIDVYKTSSFQRLCCEMHVTATDAAHWVEVERRVLRWALFYGGALGALEGTCSKPHLTLSFTLTARVLSSATLRKRPPEFPNYGKVVYCRSSDFVCCVTKIQTGTTVDH